jgi:probable HAF family extracellular repeat protein
MYTMARASLLLSSLLLSSLLLPSPLLLAQSFSAVKIPTLNPQNGGTLFVTGLNDSGQVTGYETSVAGWQPYIWSDAAGTQNINGSCQNGYGYGISNDGVVVGWCSTGAAEGYGFYWSSATGVVNTGISPVAINVSGEAVGSSAGSPAFWNLTSGASLLDESGWATAINDSGQVAGNTGPWYSPNPFLWTSTAGIEQIPNPSGSYAQAQAINSSGEIVGSFSPTAGGDAHAFLWTSSGGMEDLGDLGPSATNFAFSCCTPYGINGNGYIVGNYNLNTSDCPGDYGCAFLWSSTAGYQYLTAMTTDLPKGTILLYAAAINKWGQVVANSIGERGYLLTPIMTPTLTSSPNPSVDGQPVTLTATVNSAIGPPPDGDQVTFKWSNTVLGAVPITNGVATLTYSTLPVGTHSIEATYGGDSVYAAASSNAVKQVVTLASTTTTLFAVPNPAAYGEAEGLIATVTSSAPAGPSGTVTFKNGSTTLGTSPVVEGYALLALTNLPVGSDSLTATYNGDSQDGKSTSVPFIETVDQAVVNLTLVSSPNPSNKGQSVTLTATLTSNGGVPTGTVTFSYNGSTLGTAHISAGQAVFHTSALPVGSDLVTATFAGSVDYSVASGSATQTVQQ